MMGHGQELKSRQSTPGAYARDSYHILDVEIDQGIQQTCSDGLFQVDKQDIPLYYSSQVPDFLQSPFVVEGYRAFLPFSLCLKSLFVWSNETVNIWSHLLGFVLFFFLSVYDNLITLPRHNGTISDHVILTLGLVCFQFCMLCSTGFHMFACHSEKASRRWLTVDLAGISVGVIGCYLPAVHYAFYCLSIWRDIYLFIIAVLSISTLVVQLHPRFLSSGMFRQRISIYCALVAYGILPTIHWIYLNGGWSTGLVQLFVPKVVVMYSLGTLAFIFYITKFPERFFPGRFDYIGSSHQIWHFIVVLSFVWWHQAGQDIRQYRSQHACLSERNASH